MHKVEIKLGPFGTSVVNSIKMDGKDVNCTAVNVHAEVGALTDVTLELASADVELTLEDVSVRFVRPAPSYMEWASSAR